VAQAARRMGSFPALLEFDAAIAAVGVLGPGWEGSSSSSSSSGSSSSSSGATNPPVLLIQDREFEVDSPLLSRVFALRSFLGSTLAWWGEEEKGGGSSSVAHLRDAQQRLSELVVVAGGSGGGSGAALREGGVGDTARIIRFAVAMGVLPGSTGKEGGGAAGAAALRSIYDAIVGEERQCAQALLNAALFSGGGGGAFGGENGGDASKRAGAAFRTTLPSYDVPEELSAYLDSPLNTAGLLALKGLTSSAI
jgi:hypothetical protein